MENKNPVGKLALAPKRCVLGKGAQQMGRKIAELEIKQHLKSKKLCLDLSEHLIP